MRLIAALTAKPWLTPGLDAAAQAAPDRGGRSWDRGIGLGVFLAVVTILFTLIASAYVMRMGGHGDHGVHAAGPDGWRAIGEPPLLWLNTALLAASSLAFHVALGRARSARAGGAATALLAGGLIGLAFLAGQLILWRQLAGCFVPGAAAGSFCPAAAESAGAARGWAASPAAAFFYLISGAHGLHLIGGLIAWGLTARRLAALESGAAEARTAAARAIQLCARYWDYMLLVWLAMMGLFVAT